MDGEPHSSYQKTTTPLQAEEGGGVTNLKGINPRNDPRHHFSILQLAWADEISPLVYPSCLSHRPGA
jgi:hypothetical protein